MHPLSGLGRFRDPENIILIAFLLVLAWAPFPYGSNRTWAEFALGGALGGVLAIWAGFALSGFAGVTSLTSRLFRPALCVGLALLWALIQLTDLRVLAVLTGIDLTGLAHPVWLLAEQTLATTTGAYISVNPEATFHAIFACVISGSAFMLSFELSRGRERAAMLFDGIMLIVAAYSGLAIASIFAPFDWQSWILPDAKLDYRRMSGPFVNPNHFATFVAIGALVTLGSFVESLRQSVVWDRGWRVTVRTMLLALSGVNALRLACLILMLATLSLSQSRAGVVSFLAGTLALAIALSVGRQTSEGEASGQRAGIAILVAFLGISAALSITPMLQRVEASTLTDNTRWSIAASTWSAIQTAPLSGQGFGAFEHYYPFFADGTVKGSVDEAHNDFLETLADLGLPAGLALIAAPIMLVHMCWLGCFRRRRDRAYPAVGVAAAVTVGLHSLADFSLQIPAVAVLFAVVLGAGVAQSWRTNMDLVR